MPKKYFCNSISVYDDYKECSEGVVIIDTVNYLPSTTLYMPRKTERQAITDEIVHTIALLHINRIQEDIDNVLVDTDDDESDSGTDSGDQVLSGLPHLLICYLASIHADRYMNGQAPIMKSSSNLVLMLYVHKTERPLLFRRAVRLDPDTFDSLVAAISSDNAFLSGTSNSQMPVEWQLAIVLYRFGHFGNAASMQDIALWAGVEYGTVNVCTRRVIKAVCCDRFRSSAVAWLGPEEKESSKRWVESRS